MRLVAVDGMLPLPAGATKILETLEVPAKVGADHTVTHGAKGVFQIRINLDLQDGVTSASGQCIQQRRGMKKVTEKGLAKGYGKDTRLVMMTRKTSNTSQDKGKGINNDETH